MDVLICFQNRGVFAQEFHASKLKHRFTFFSGISQEHVPLASMYCSPKYQVSRNPMVRAIWNEQIKWKTFLIFSSTQREPPKIEYFASMWGLQLSAKMGVITFKWPNYLPVESETLLHNSSFGW